MQGLGSFSSFLKESKKDCNGFMSIQDINAQYSYEDKIEWELLSCGQAMNFIDFMMNIFQVSLKDWHISK